MGNFELGVFDQILCNHQKHQITINLNRVFVFNVFQIIFCKGLQMKWNNYGTETKQFLINQWIDTISFFLSDCKFTLNFLFDLSKLDPNYVTLRNWLIIENKGII